MRAAQRGDRPPGAWPPGAGAEPSEEADGDREGRREDADADRHPRWGQRFDRGTGAEGEDGEERSSRAHPRAVGDDRPDRGEERLDADEPPHGCVHRREHDADDDSGEEEHGCLELVDESQLVRLAAAVHAAEGTEDRVDDELLIPEDEEDERGDRDAEADPDRCPPVVIAGLEAQGAPQIVDDPLHGCGADRHPPGGRRTYRGAVIPPGG